MTNQISIESIDQTDEIPLIVFKDLVGKGKSMKVQIQKVSEERRRLQKEHAILQRTNEIMGQIC